LPELRKDPIVGRWVIISTDRAKRPTDFVREGVRIKGGFCPFCPGNEAKTPPEIQAYRPNPNGGPPPLRDTPGWTVRVVPNKFPALGIEGNLNRQAEGLFDKMNGIGAHEVIIETPDHASTLATMPPKRIEDMLWTFRDRILDLKKDRRFKARALPADRAADSADLRDRRAGRREAVLHLQRALCLLRCDPAGE
jgi:UDPglucose--hexose-1-phosphate uridylyltransferase